MHPGIKSLRNTLLFCAIFAAIVAVLLITGGCGHTARMETQLPQIAQSWEMLRPDALVIADDQALAPMDQAIESADATAMPVTWASVRPLVEAGIEAQLQSGAILERLAASKRELVNQLDTAISVFCKLPDP